MLRNITLFILLTFVSTNSFALKLTSSSIQNRKYLTNDQVYNGFGCSGKNISPALSWFDIPENTKSFAITAYDPDAPTGSGWWHWLVFNIPTNTTNVPEGVKTTELPKSVIQSRNDFGETKFGGACPPEGHGKHRYIFKVFALDIENLPLTKDVTAATVGYFINQHKIAEAKITAYYKR